MGQRKAGCTVMTKHLERLLCEDSGQDLIEYALLVSLIGMVSVLGLNTLGPVVADFYNELNIIMTGL